MSEVFNKGLENDTFWVLSENEYLFTVAYYTYYVKLETKKNALFNQILVIEKTSLKIYEIGKHLGLKEIENKSLIPQMHKTIPIFALLGIIDILGTPFLVVVHERSVVGSIDGSEVFTIKGVQFIPISCGAGGSLSPPRSGTAKQQNKELKNYIEIIGKVFTSGFYFSYNYDLTSSKQRTSQLQNDTGPISTHTDQRYYWNYSLYSHFFKQGVNPYWFVPVIQGYVFIGQEIFDQKPIKLALISRRRHLRAGTRYNARGIDEDGNVANFVETEQIVSYMNTIYSYTQIRGSVPLFWQQTGLTAEVSFTKTSTTTKIPFLKHIEDLKNDYSFTMFVNLLQSARPYENLLTKYLVEQFNFNNIDIISKYEYFDFHKLCKGDNYEILEKLIDKIDDCLKIFGYYTEDSTLHKSTTLQKGIFRTNCLDCLDRTNVVQTKIATKVLKTQLEKLEVNVSSIFNPSSDISQKKNILQHPFLMMYKTAWSQNGDNLSKQYSGTGSTHSSVTRNGKQGFMGFIQHKMVTVNRFIINNFDDKIKHDCIQMIIGKYEQSIIVCEDVKRMRAKSAINVIRDKKKETVNINGRQLLKVELKKGENPENNSPDKRINLENKSGLIKIKGKVDKSFLNNTFNSEMSGSEDSSSRSSRSHSLTAKGTYSKYKCQGKMKEELKGYNSLNQTHNVSQDISFDQNDLNSSYSEGQNDYMAYSDSEDSYSERKSEEQNIFRIDDGPIAVLETPKFLPKNEVNSEKEELSKYDTSQKDRYNTVKLTNMSMNNDETSKSYNTAREYNASPDTMRGISKSNKNLIVVGTEKKRGFFKNMMSKSRGPAKGK